MKRLFALVLLSAPLCVLAGCAMCCSPLDYAYPTYGGKWQRVDREHGRVGSVFTPQAGVKVDEHQLPAEAVIEGEIIEGEMIEGGIIEGEMVPSISQDSGEIVEPARLITRAR